MYVVLVTHKSKNAMTDLMSVLKPQFPNEVFTIEGTEDSGFKFRIEGLGDELEPRKVAEKFLKTWSPSTKEVEIIQPPTKKTSKTIKVKSNVDDMLKSILPKGK